MYIYIMYIYNVYIYIYTVYISIYIMYIYIYNVYNVYIYILKGSSFCSFSVENLFFVVGPLLKEHKCTMYVVWRIFGCQSPD